MSILRYIKKLQQLDALIRRKSTGNQKEFCKKTCMSRSVLNDYLNEMKELGFPIEYDRKRETYFYKENGSLVDKFFEKRMDNEEVKKYNGGQYLIPDTELTSIDWIEPFLLKVS